MFVDTTETYSTCATRAFSTTIKVKTEVGVEGVLAATPLEFPFPEPTEQAVVKTEQGVQVGAPSKPLLAVVKKEDGSGT